MKRRRGIGQFLLKGFQKRGRRPRRALPRKRPSTPVERLLLAKSTDLVPVSAAVEAQIVTPKVALSVDSSRRFEKEAETSSLTLAGLIRPDERLQQSIQGFLLDQRSEHTRLAYGKDLKRFIKFLIARAPTETGVSIARAHIIAYKDSLLSENLQHTTVDRHLATLRSFFQWLVDDGFLEKNVAEGVRFLNPKRLSTTIGFSDEEVRRLLAIPNLHTRIGSLHYAVLMILFYCGLRRSEVCSLRASCLGEERGQKVIRLRGKGNSERIIPLIPPVWSALKHYSIITARSLAGDDWLFAPIRNNRTGENKKPIDPSMIYYIVTRYAKIAGIANRVSPHSCRATAISNARDHNVPDRAIQEFAGWASPSMITRYDKRKTAVTDSAAHSISYGVDPSLPPSQAERKPVLELGEDEQSPGQS